MKETPYPAPKFSLPNAQGTTVSLSDYSDKWLVVYFYPKDDTPGCAKEACSLRDVYDELRKINADIVGISQDDADSHQKFARKHDLAFELLSDKSGDTIEAYGAWSKKMFGKVGIQRTTFIIDPSGDVVKAYDRVTPDGHGEQVADDINGLQAAAGAYGAGEF